MTWRPKMHSSVEYPMSLGFDSMPFGYSVRGHCDISGCAAVREGLAMSSAVAARPGNALLFIFR